MAHRLNAAAAAAVLGLLAAGGAGAQENSSPFLARISVTQIRPDVKSGDLTAPSLAGTQADIKSDTQLTGAVSYILSDNVEFDLPLSAGFKHDIVGAGAIAGTGKIGEVKALPLTLLAQYHFLPASDALRPYLGAGPTYAKFYKARSTAALSGLTGGTPDNPTTLSIDSKWAATVQAGLTYKVGGGWYLDGSVLKTFLKTRATLSTGQTLDAKLDPWTITAGLGYRF